MASPRNPNVCASCEQLLADDCAEMERLLNIAGVGIGQAMERADELEFLAKRVPDLAEAKSWS